MALKLNLEQTQFGIPAPEAYARIISFSGDKNNIQVQVCFYYDENARNVNGAAIRTEAYYINVADLSGDIIPALYTALKTLDPYKDAIDV